MIPYVKDGFHAEKSFSHHVMPKLKVQQDYQPNTVDEPTFKLETFYSKDFVMQVPVNPCWIVTEDGSYWFDQENMNIEIIRAIAVALRETKKAIYLEHMLLEPEFVVSLFYRDSPVFETKKAIYNDNIIHDVVDMMSGRISSLMLTAHQPKVDIVLKSTAWPVVNGVTI